ncbi:inositol monophosphatase family protein [Halosolutus gelatinilyticus]|uniref:inositol monophosphatase family protein n=1 Tax=Halosolutus gelatinilyticus TaxID=2931975 RepID=UPI001FF5C411|nr:inositol monophosphatase [Halosolutus gelatinilyticus]
MSDSDAQRRADVAVRAAAAGADVAADSFRTGIDVELKGSKTDVVTQADRDAQTAVIERIRSAFPEEPIVGEEEDALKEVPETGPAWIVDPIDGTNNFVDGIRAFGTAVAAVEDGEPIAGGAVFPALGDTYRVGPEGIFRNDESVSVSEATDPETCTVCPTAWWDLNERDRYAALVRSIVTRFDDMRRFGCAQLELMLLASGAFDGVVTDVRMNPWDSVAGVRAVREAGGTVTDLDGDRWRHDSRGLVASNGGIHDELLAAVHEIDSNNSTNRSGNRNH